MGKFQTVRLHCRQRIAQFQNIWFYHRQKIERILRAPTVCVVVLWLIRQLYIRIQQYQHGFGNILEVSRWVIFTFGSVGLIVIFPRAWSELFYDGEETLADTWGILLGGPKWKIAEALLGLIFIAIGVFGILRLIAPNVALSFVDRIYSSIRIYAMIILIPVLVIGYVRYGMRLFKK